MFRPLLCSLLVLLLPLALRAQEPPSEPPTAETADPEATPQTSESPDEDDDGELEGQLTPKEEEARRKAEERTAKREERRARRAEKLAREEEKQLEKEVQQEAKKDERVVELLDLGYAAIEAGEYKNARDRFEKIKELERGKSYDAEMGLARLQLAQLNYAQAIQLAQGAAEVARETDDKIEALTFAGDVTLKARPTVEGRPDEPLPGTEMFADTALRFYIHAVALAPTEPTRARAHLEQRFPGTPDERAERLLEHYVELVPDGESRHGRRVAAAYETLLTGVPADGTPVAVVPPISPPERRSGAKPAYTDDNGKKTRRRLIVGLVITPEGTVSRVDVLNGVHRGQDAAARKALRQWVFEPARLPNGTPLTVYWLHGVTMAPAPE